MHRHRSRTRRRGTVVAVAAVAALTSSACAADASTPPEGTAAAVPAPHWQPCPDTPTLDCATLTVPLRHDDPGAGTVELALSRLAATGPGGGEPIVVHRGGPGYSTLDYLALIDAGQVAAPVDERVRARHDLVAVDQRGTGRSGPPSPCPTTPPPVGAPPTAPVPGARAGLLPFPDVPVTDAGLDAALSREQEIRQRCRTSDVAAHLGTVDAARDLDLVRRALGQDRLTMIGQSYGGYLATVYAALFGDHAGRLVLDSTVGPARGAEGGTMAGRTDNDVATEQVLADFLARCGAAGPACAFGAGDPAGTFAATIAALRSAPVPLRTPDGATVTLTAPHVLEQVGTLLYQPVTWAPALAPYLQAVAGAVADPQSPTAAQVALGVALADQRPDDSLQTGFAAVTCAEVPTPADGAAWAAAVAQRAPLAPYAAALRAADVLPCVGEPRTAAPLPALDVPLATDAEVLLVHNRLDPATPLSGAQRAAALFPGSTLLVNEGPGHVAAQQSRCTVDAVSTFLLTGAPPAPAATCTPDRDPFAP